MTKPQSIVLSSSDLERFWSKVHKTQSCWLWTGAQIRDGYGSSAITVGKRELAHRVSWTLVNGQIPKDIMVLHKCDNPSCIRPDHLFLGTSQANAQDRDDKGRSGMRVLTEQDVREIRQQRKDGVELEPLAKAYGVTASCIWKILHNVTWRRTQEEL